MRRRAIRFALLLSALALSSALTPSAEAAQDPYEPNDSIVSAAGPLAFDQTLAGELHTQDDRDFFFFYVASRAPSQATLAAANLGVGLESPLIDVTIMDAEVTPLGAISYLEPGTRRDVTLTLPPGKYLVEVAVGQAYSATLATPYTLTGGGSRESFGSFSQVAGRCARATKALRKARTRLRRAQSRLQRADARRRLSRYGSATARQRARRSQRRARRRVGARRRAQLAAKRAKQPWCSIPR